MAGMLETERLGLRPLRADDAGAIARYCGDLAVSRWLSSVPHPYGLADATTFLTRIAPRAGQVWAIERRTEPGLIGMIGLGDPDRPINLGYWLGRPYWGRGIVSEAARAVVDQAFGEGDRERLTSGIFRGNEASLAIQRKLGFEVVGQSQMACRARGETLPHLDTLLTRARWLAVARRARAAGRES